MTKGLTEPEIKECWHQSWPAADQAGEGGAEQGARALRHRGQGASGAADGGATRVDQGGQAGARAQAVIIPGPRWERGEIPHLARDL